MTEKRAARRLSRILWTAVVAMLLAGYVAAYYWMVRPIQVNWGAGSSVVESYWRPYGERAADDFERSVSVQRWRRFFAPVHWFDRRLRAAVWEPK
jgi:hypothetical protein